MTTRASIRRRRIAAVAIICALATAAVAEAADAGWTPRPKPAQGIKGK